MKYPTINQILEIHHKSLIRFSGEKGILHKNQLLNLINDIKQAQYYGKKNTIELAAWILVRIVQNHYFIDGNKRTALGTTLVFLKSNNCNWELPSKYFFFDLTMNIAQAQNTDKLKDVEKELKKVIMCD